MSAVRPQSAVGDVRSGLDISINLPQTPGTGEQRAGSTPRPATAGLATGRSSVSTPRQSTIPDDTGPHRDALSYFDSFKKDELREFIAQSTASWMLSPDFRGNTSLPCGLISNLTLNQDPDITLLFAKEEDVPNLEYRELHQIVRELTTGIFCGNQMPSLCLEPNFDSSSTCQMPIVYKDTRVGQVLMAVDYAMKSFWHGVYVPKKKRSKLSERWRALLDVNTATGEYNKAKNPYSDFTAAGQENVTDKNEFKDLYSELNKVDPSGQAAEKENRFFSNYSEYARCVITTFLSRVRSSPVANVVAIHAASDVTSAVTLPDHDHIHPMALQRLQRRLRHHMKVIRDGMERDATTRRNLALLRFIASVSVLLVALRRRLMRVPNVDGLLTPLSGDVLRTETEIPPFAVPPKSAHSCETFTLDHTGERRHLVTAHGEIQFDVDTNDIEVICDDDWSNRVRNDAKKHLKELLLNRPRQEYPTPTTFQGSDEYYVVHIPLSTYYPATPPQPAWLHARYQLLSTYRPRKLPMNDLQLAEMFKRVFGFRQALANKSTEGCLKLSSCRGLSAPFVALMRKTASSSLFSPDVQGMTLLHQACIYNRSSILSILLGNKPSLNVRRTEINSKTTRATPLHFAARCGALECVTALLASKVNPFLSDARGYSAIHIACSSGHTSVVRSLLRRHPNLLEVRATGGDNATPLLVAASSGALDCLKFLIKSGATVRSCDVNNDGPVQRAALSYHTDVIKYLISLEGRKDGDDEESLNVWPSLVEMLECRFVSRQDASLRCLEVLLHRTPTYWRPLLAADAVPPLVNLLRSARRRPKSGTMSLDSGLGKDLEDETTSPIRSLACSVICLMSEQDDVRVEIANAGAIPTLISLLKPMASHDLDPVHQDLESTDERCEIQSRSSVVLSDLAHVDDNASRIAAHGGIRPLVELLQVDVVDVLVNVINTLASLCRGDTSGAGDIQRRIMECGASGFLVDFLTVKDDSLQTATADAIAAVCDDNQDNQKVENLTEDFTQNEFVQIGVLAPLVAILRGHCIPAQMKAALAVGCITRGNQGAQHEASLEEAPTALCRLFQIWSDEVKERGACALWSLAGHHPEQQRAIARRIGTSQIIDMLLSKSDTLQLIGCQAVAAWSWKSSSSQARLSRDNTIPPLIRLLRLEKTSRKVVMGTLDAINKMCIGVAHINNKTSQLTIAEEGAIELLVNRVWKTSRDEKMQVDLLHCLSCLVSGCQENEDKLNELDGFGFEIILQVCNSPSMAVKLQAVSALTMFAFNRIQQQQRISRLGGLTLITFEDLFRCKDPIFKTTAAFQLVVLARIITNTSLVESSARGVITLVNFLDDVNDDVVAMAADYLASLAHTRAGVPEAIVTCGAVEKLLGKVKSENQLVRQTAAQALGYLSFNRTASRELMTSCRATEGLYVTLTDNLGEDGKVSDEFVAEFKRQATIGLPIVKEKRRPSRPQTAQTRGNTLHVNGAAHRTMRARSISPANRKVSTNK